ncbi:MAG: hypothetical protein V5A32_07865, partial [Halovenus sp.]
SVLLVYTHVFGSFIVLAQNAYVLPRLLLSARPWPGIGRFEQIATSLRQWLGLQAFVALLVAPWWGTLLTRLPTISQGGCTKITWIPEPTLDSVAMTIQGYFFYCETPDFPGQLFAIVSILALGLAALGSITASSDRTGFARPGGSEMIVLLWFLTPLVVPYVLSHTITPIMITRYTIGVSLALFLLVGKGVQALGPYVPTALRVLLVGVLLFSLIAPLPIYYEDDQKRQWDDAVDSIESSANQDDLVLISKSHLVPPYQYYAHRPEETIAGISHVATLPEVRATVGDHEDVWLVLSWTDRTDIAIHLRSLNYAAVETRHTRGIKIYHFVREDSL